MSVSLDGCLVAGVCARCLYLMTFDRHILGPDIHKIVGNARICRSEIVMEELHVVTAVHDGCIRQLDDLAWAWHAESGRLAQRIFEDIRIPTNDYLVCLVT